MVSLRNTASRGSWVATAVFGLAAGCRIESSVPHAPRPDDHTLASRVEASVSPPLPIDRPTVDAVSPAPVAAPAPTPPAPQVGTAFPLLRGAPWEAPLADGYCAQRGGHDPVDCATTSVRGSALSLDVRHAPDVTGVALRVSTLTYAHVPGEPSAATRSLHLGVAATVLYGIVQLSFGNEDTRVVEVYRGDRAEIETLLGAVRRRVRSYRRGHEPLGCPEGERAVVMTLDVRDLDGDGSDEVLASVASQVGDDWFCRWTEVFDRRDPSLQRGAIPYGLPSLAVYVITTPDGARTTLVAGTPDGTASQSFVAYALLNGRIERVAQLEGEGSLVQRGGTWQVDLVPDWRAREGGARWRRSYVWNGQSFVDARSLAVGVEDAGVPDAAR